MGEQAKGHVMKKKLLIISLSAVVIIGAGVMYADYIVKRQLANQVVTMLDSPAAKNEIAKLEQNVPVPNINLPPSVTGSLGGNSGGGGGNSTTGSGVGAGGAGQGAAGAAGSTGSGSSGGDSAGNVGNPNSQSGQASSGTSASGGSSAPVFTSRQQIVTYAMSQFTHAEIVNYMTLYLNRKSLTAQQKLSIKEQILSHFTPAEIKDMAAAASKYH